MGGVDYQPGGCRPPPHPRASLKAVIFENFCLIISRSGNLHGGQLLLPYIVDWYCLSQARVFFLPTYSNFVVTLSPNSTDTFMCGIQVAQ